MQRSAVKLTDVSENTYCLLFQGWIGSKISIQQEVGAIWQPPASSWYMHGLLFKPEDGDNMFTRNVGELPDYTVLHPRTYY
jgi:hypothetical protein